MFMKERMVLLSLFVIFAISTYTVPALDFAISLVMQQTYFSPDSVFGSLGLLAYYTFVLSCLCFFISVGMISHYKNRKDTANRSFKMAGSVFLGAIVGIISIYN